MSTFNVHCIIYNQFETLDLKKIESQLLHQKMFSQRNVKKIKKKNK